LRIKEKYIKILENTEKKYEDKLSHIQNEFEKKVLVRKDTKSIRESMSNNGQEDSPAHEKEVTKWKLEYKHLK
jgi:hypothetical protein